MKQLTHSIINGHQGIIRYLLILSAIALIVYWLPQGGQFKFEFAKGKIWQYEDLYAPFDFTVEKAAQEIEDEETILLESFLPYYNLEKGLPFDDQFESYFNLSYKNALTNSSQLGLSKKQIKSAQEDLAGHLFKHLKKFYEEGIFEVASIRQLNNGKSKYINCLRGNIASKTRVRNLPSMERIKKMGALQAKNNKYPSLYAACFEEISNNLNFPKFKYDEELNQKLQEELFSSISSIKIGIQKSESIIKKGTLVNQDKFQVLTALKKVYETGGRGKRNAKLTAFGFFLLICLTMAILMVYLFIYQERIFRSNRNIIYILSIIVSFIYLIGWVKDINTDTFGELSIYVIPVCIVPIVIRAFFDSVTAIFTTVTVILITGYIVPNSFEYVVLSFIASFFAIFSTRKMHYLSQFYRTSVLILITYFVGYFGTILIQSGSVEDIDYTTFGWLTLNALLTLMAFPLISIFEKIFGLVSEITIFELSDMNKPLLKQLSMKAPGTFQHSLQVANLAEAAAREVKGNPLLTRVGSLYHDIGKMHMPTYYIENQITGVNPHDELNFEDSAKIIIDHVIQGIEMAKKANLPDIIIDFIRTHHGNTRVEYFYQSFLKNYPDQEVDESKFRYPGPIPFSKETACLMLADSVEAASRSLKNPSEDDINRLVDGIIDFKVKNEQLINCDITFRDVTRVKALFKRMLKSIYHVRISYPEAA